MWCPAAAGTLALTTDASPLQLVAADAALARVYHVCTDAIGTAYTASSEGALVAISGTGSAARLCSRTAGDVRSGGWGHMIGDEGSGYWIASRAIKTVFRTMDGFAKSDEDAARGAAYGAVLRAAMMEHFALTVPGDLLSHMYSDFRKDHVASFCKRVADAAVAGDALAKDIFAHAGANLARMVAALVPHVPSAKASASVDIVCVGSVWKSFALFERAFMDTLLAGGGVESRRLRHVRLLRLRQSSALGAALLGARAAHVDLPLDFASFTETLGEAEA